MSTKKSTIEIVAGAGGAKGPALIGGFKALEEKNVAIGKLTDVSAGSLVATFYANGFNASELEEIFLTEPLRHKIAERFNSPRAWLNPTSIVRGIVSLKPDFERLVKEYDLKPMARIIAWNLFTGKPIEFDGDYDVAQALAASCGIPFIMAPVRYNPPVRRGLQLNISAHSAMTMSKRGLLFDGGIHHFHPTKYSDGDAIVFKLGLASRLPSERPRPIEAAFHLAEMALAPALNKLSPESPNDIVIPVGPKDVGGLSFSASDQKCREMIDYGYRMSCTMLDEAIDLGRVPLKAA